MEEGIIDSALETCLKLETSLSETLQMVTDMNKKYNENCAARNWRSYITDILTKYNSKDDDDNYEIDGFDQDDIPDSKSDLLNKNQLQDLTPRSSHELLGLNSTLNFRFIKIKRNLESVMTSVKRTIKLAERQTDYSQMDLNWRTKKFEFVR